MDGKNDSPKSVRKILVSDRGISSLFPQATLAEHRKGERL